MDDQTFVRTAYQVIMQREPDEQGFWDWVRFLEGGNWRKDLVSALVASEEFRTLGSEPLLVRLHRARCAWVASLPAATLVLDIGGSSPTDPVGALKEMGWTGTPERLTIVDLPPDDQYHGRPTYSQAEPFVTPWGGEVHYLHARAEDLPDSDVLSEVRFDGVFMGQAIEHIEVAVVPQLLAWIRSRVTDDGWFAFDTPNRAVTLLQFGPDAFSDPDHTIEYDVPQMERLLADAGFGVVSSSGIMPCRQSVSQGTWDPRDTYDEPLFDDDAPNGWAMGFVAAPIRPRFGRLRRGVPRSRT